MAVRKVPAPPWRSWHLWVVTAAAVAAIVIITAISPRLLGLPADGLLNAWGTVVAGGVAIGLGGAALATLWRSSQRVAHIADQQRRTTQAYLAVAGTLMLTLDQRGIVMAANRHTCLTLDREEDEVVGHEWFGLALPEEYRDEARRLFWLSFQAYRETGEMSFGTIDYENEVECRDGSRRQIQWWATMVCDRAGRPIEMVCSGTDVTDQRAAAAALERNRVELEALRRLAQKIASLDDSRQAVVDATLALTDASAVVILEPNRERTHLEVTTTTREEFRGGSTELAREPTFAASAFLSGQPHFIADCTASPAVNQQLVKALGLRSGLHQPIIGGHGPIGVLTVVWEQPVRSLHDRKAELVGLIAHEAAISLRRRESLLQLERAALVDPLTGVANRRAFDAELPLALRRAGQGNYPLGLVVLDVNEFKAVNDLYGHEVGDELLIRAASAWAGVLRAGDLLARLGGDEFAVLLPSCDELEMAHIIRRLKRATPHQPGTSMGGALWDGTEGASSLIRRADRAQYADKSAMKSAASDDRAMDLSSDASAARLAARPRAEDPRAQAPWSGDAPDLDPGDDKPQT
ncbi:MAG: sensor domain-containing diguanylate cyclase [Solirubrobacteraceae bacterium]|nr:sensor domain-containing diguanylate cyclase [Solirubrobacteraceae bacterium]